jgi:hypothetical protein
MEGFASFLMLRLFEAFGGNWRGRIGALLVRKNLRRLREGLDPHEYGGAPLLGVNGVTIISHGSSTAVAIKNAIRAAANEALVRHVNAEISDVLGRIEPVAAPAKVERKGLRALFSRMRERFQRQPRAPEPSALEAAPAAAEPRDAHPGDHAAPPAPSDSRAPSPAPATLEADLAPNGPIPEAPRAETGAHQPDSLDDAPRETAGDQSEPADTPEKQNPS